MSYQQVIRSKYRVSAVKNRKSHPSELDSLYCERRKPEPLDSPVITPTSML